MLQEDGCRTEQQSTDRWHFLSTPAHLASTVLCVPLHSVLPANDGAAEQYDGQNAVEEHHPAACPAPQLVALAAGHDDAAVAELDPIRACPLELKAGIADEHSLHRSGQRGQCLLQPQLTHIRRMDRNPKA